jgi:hypothetical protein
VNGWFLKDDTYCYAIIILASSEAAIQDGHLKKLIGLKQLLETIKLNQIKQTTQK